MLFIDCWLLYIYIYIGKDVVDCWLLIVDCWFIVDCNDDNDVIDDWLVIYNYDDTVVLYSDDDMCGYFYINRWLLLYLFI
jgi:hypothetical protein